MQKKKKILVLSDHAMSTSGVGTQTRHLINGLLKKNEWTFRQFGAAMKHADYKTVRVNDDFVIKPIDGFGDRNLLRLTLATEKPDLIFIFTDPRFFIWLWEMEDEIHQVCPIAYWHVWDNKPFPKFNETLYESTDTINCHSYLTYKMLSESMPNKPRINFIPHAVPEDIFYRLSDKERKEYKRKALGVERENHFVVIWNNRNARRKRPGDLLFAWKEFLEKTKKKDAVLIMHTDPLDKEGSNLYILSEELGIKDSVFFSRERLEFNKINVLYNISDACINISYAEGFGLSTLEAMQTGAPIIAVKTGGLTRQVVDHRDGSINGVALDVTMKTMSGSQQVPYIYEDYAANDDIVSALFEVYSYDEQTKNKMSKKVMAYANSEFNMQTTVDLWHDSLNETINTWKDDYKPWDVVSL
jgi:glycosyltransferase involved in cell wall biosynthesis